MLGIKHVCPACKSPVASVDSSDGIPKLISLNDAIITVQEDRAPRIKCSCGRVMILLKGTLG